MTNPTSRFQRRIQRQGSEEEEGPLLPTTMTADDPPPAVVSSSFFFFWNTNNNNNNTLPAADFDSNLIPPQDVSVDAVLTAFYFNTVVFVVLMIMYECLRRTLPTVYSSRKKIQHIQYNNYMPTTTSSSTTTTTQPTTAEKGHVNGHDTTSSHAAAGAAAAAPPMPNKSPLMMMMDSGCHQQHSTTTSSLGGDGDRQTSTSTLPDDRPLDWIGPVFRVPWNKVRKTAGLDGYFFLRYIRMNVRITAVSTFWFFTILVPIYASGSNPDNNAQHGWYHVSAANISSNGWKMWAPIVFAYLFSAFIAFVIKQEYRHFLEIRQAFLAKGNAHVDPQHHYSLMIENIPYELRSDRALFDYFDKLFPGKVHSASVVMNLPDLQECSTRCLRTCRRLEKSIAYLQATQQRPTHTVGSTCSCGGGCCTLLGVEVVCCYGLCSSNNSGSKKRNKEVVMVNTTDRYAQRPPKGTCVDSISYYTQELAAHSRQLAQMQQRKTQIAESGNHSLNADNWYDQVARNFSQVANRILDDSVAAHSLGSPADVLTPQYLQQQMKSSPYYQHYYCANNGNNIANHHDNNSHHRYAGPTALAEQMSSGYGSFGISVRNMTIGESSSHSENWSSLVSRIREVPATAAAAAARQHMSYQQVGSDDDENEERNNTVFKTRARQKRGHHHQEPHGGDDLIRRLSLEQHPPPSPRRVLEKVAEDEESLELLLPTMTTTPRQEAAVSSSSSRRREKRRRRKNRNSRGVEYPSSSDEDEEFVVDDDDDDDEASVNSILHQRHEQAQQQEEEETKPLVPEQLAEQQRRKRRTSFYKSTLRRWAGQLGLDFLAAGVKTVNRGLDVALEGVVGATMSSTGFVTFLDLTSTTCAASAPLSVKASVLHTKVAPEARDIRWESAHVSKSSRQSRERIVNVVLIMGVILWSFPLAAIQAFAKSQYLAQIPGLEWILTFRGGYVSHFVNGYLPVVALLALIMLLPLLFEFLAVNYEHRKTYSGVQKSMMGRYFYYQLANVYVSVTAGSIYKSLAQIMQSPYSILSLLGESLPTMVGYFVALLVTKILAGLPMIFLRFGALSRLLVLKSLSSPSEGMMTQRELDAVYRLENIQYGWEYPAMLLVVVIVFTYAVICPVILPFGLFYFLGALVVYKKQILYVYSPIYESGGAMFPTAVQRTLFGLVCGQMMLLGYTATRGCMYQPLCLVPLPILTILGMNYFYRTYAEPSARLSLERAREYDRVSDLQAAAAAAKLAAAGSGDDDHSSRPPMPPTPGLLSSPPLLDDSYDQHSQQQQQQHSNNLYYATHNGNGAGTTNAEEENAGIEARRRTFDKCAYRQPVLTELAAEPWTYRRGIQDEETMQVRRDLRQVNRYATTQASYESIERAGSCSNTCATRNRAIENTLI